MPKKIRQVDIDNLWHTYESIHGTQPLVKGEVLVGVRKLLRAAGAPNYKDVEVKFVTGRNQTRFVERNQLNVNLQTGGWREIAHSIGWRADNGTMATQMKLARKVCEEGWLVGKMIPKPKPKPPPPTKDEQRAVNIARLKARRDAWFRKKDRAVNAIKKIDRSLAAYRRHGHG